MSWETAARAQALLDAGRPEQALETLAIALASEPEDTSLLRVLARAQLDLDDAANALKTAERLTALDPESYEGHYYCALAHDRLRHKKQAVRCARTASLIAPHNPHVLGALAEYTGRAGDHDQARQIAQRAIALAPDASAGYFSAGLVELDDLKWRRAAKWFERVLEIEPHNTGAQFNLTIANEGAGRIAPALGGTDALLRFDPTDPDARKRMDEIVYTTLVHLLWVVLVLAYVVPSIRSIP